MGIGTVLHVNTGVRFSSMVPISPVTVKISHRLLQEIFPFMYKYGVTINHTLTDSSFQL